MRSMMIWLAALTLGVGFAGRASAQAVGFGATSGPMQYRVVSTDNPNAPIASPQVFDQNTNATRFFRNSPGRINNQTVVGKSNFPTERQMPGEDYLKAFHIKRYARTAPPSVWYNPWSW